MDAASEKTPLSRKARIYAGLLSAFLLFHLAVIIIVPNKQTYISGRFASVFMPYANLFEFSSGWSFFAPEPGPPPIYLEWALLDKNGEEIGQGRWPEVKDPYFFRDRQNRRIAATRFMASDDTHAEKMMVPVLCASDPRVHSVRLWKLVVGLPTLTDVADGKRTIGDEQDLDRRAVSLDFCGGET